MFPDTWNMKARLYALRHLVAILSVMMAIKQEATENKVSCSRRDVCALATCTVSRYCLLVLHGRAVVYVKQTD